MQTAKIIQAVVLLMIVALAASCSSTKQYTSKLFPGNQPTEMENKVAVRFLDIDSTEQNNDDWVTTDIIMGRDTVSRTFALDNFSKSYPSTPIQPDSIINKIISKHQTTGTIKEAVKPVEEPIARSTNANGVRSKKTRDD